MKKVLGMQRRWLFVAGILRIYGATRWSVWALSGDLRIPHVLKAQRDSIDVSYPQVAMDSTSLSDSSNWVRQGQLFGCE